MTLNYRFYCIQISRPFSLSSWAGGPPYWSTTSPRSPPWRPLWASPPCAPRPSPVPGRNEDAQCKTYNCQRHRITLCKNRKTCISFLNIAVPGMKLYEKYALGSHCISAMAFPPASCGLRRCCWLRCYYWRRCCSCRPPPPLLLLAPTLAGPPLLVPRLLLLLAPRLLLLLAPPLAG